MLHVSYLYDCQPLPRLPNSDSIVQAINDAAQLDAEQQVHDKKVMQAI